MREIDQYLWMDEWRVLRIWVGLKFSPGIFMFIWAHFLSSLKSEARVFLVHGFANINDMSICRFCSISVFSFRFVLSLKSVIFFFLLFLWVGYGLFVIKGLKFLRMHGILRGHLYDSIMKHLPDILGSKKTWFLYWFSPETAPSLILSCKVKKHLTW